MSQTTTQVASFESFQTNEEITKYTESIETSILLFSSLGVLIFHFVIVEKVSGN